MTVQDLQSYPVVTKMQMLRRQGLRFENGGMDETSDTTASCKGAVVQEDPEFLQRVFADVRNAWHSPHRRRQRPPMDIDAMDVDE